MKRVRLMLSEQKSVHETNCGKLLSIVFCFSPHESIPSISNSMVYLLKKKKRSELFRYLFQTLNKQRTVEIKLHMEEVDS
jgi:hypothetical protein